LSKAEIGMGAIATLAWQFQIPPTYSRKREYGTPELRCDKAQGDGKSRRLGAMLKGVDITGNARVLIYNIID
jgi:hypothetical protein